MGTVRGLFCAWLIDSILHADDSLQRPLTQWLDKINRDMTHWSIQPIQLTTQIPLARMQSLHQHEISSQNLISPCYFFFFFTLLENPAKISLRW